MQDKEKKRTIPRAAALHDLSGFGRCALTVIIPALSSMEVQCVPVPTALLSTHTGGFTGMYFADLDASIGAVGEHYGRLGLDFDAVYTGFLGSAGQVHTVEAFIDRFTGQADRGEPLIFVDPVMGDDGVLYSACIPELVCAMRRLIARAHIITPNLTEACLLAGLPYTATHSMSPGGAAELAARLTAEIGKLTDAVTVITGIDCGERVGTYADGGFFWEERRGRDYPGTGDLFASVMLGRLLGGRHSGILSRGAVREAAAYASAFTADVIEYSEKNGADQPVRDGVLLEGCLWRLADDAHAVRMCNADDSD